MKLVCIVLNGASGVTDDEAIALLNYGFDNFAPLTIADDDFNRLSGGTVIAPNGATEDNLTTEDTSSDGQITRQYYFGGTPVGTAILEDAEQQTNDAAVTGQKNMEAAQAYSASHTTAPYYIIGAIGAAFLLFFLGYGGRKNYFNYQKGYIPRLEAVAEIVYIAVAVVGICAGGNFCLNIILSHHWEIETGQFMNNAVGCNVFTGISCLLMLMLGLLDKEEGSEAK